MLGDPLTKAQRELANAIKAYAKACAFHNVEYQEEYNLDDAIKNVFTSDVSFNITINKKEDEE